MKDTLLYEGKAKKVYTVQNDPDTLILSYKNDATAFDGKKKETYNGKGALNNQISALVFDYLKDEGATSSHFIKKLNDTEQLVQKTTIIPVEVVVRNKATGSITRRLGFDEKTPFDPPLVELFYKDDILGDPLINDDHVFLLSDVTAQELQEMKEKARTINEALKKLFHSRELDLIDFKLEFGRLESGDIVLADEVSPDTCRLWDTTTQEKLDKDVFRESTGDLLGVYREVLHRLKNVEQ